MHELGAAQAVPGANHSPAGPTTPEKRRSRLARWFDSWMRMLGMALVLFLLIHTFLIEAFHIPTGSMEHTLLPGDFLFVNKAIYGAPIPGTHTRLPAFGTPRRGDVVVFPFPRNPDQTFVKRVVGVPGDTVAMRDGQMIVNDTALVETYVQRVDAAHDAWDPEFGWQRPFYVGASDDPRRAHPTRDNWGPLVVPPGKYFVLGDNRDKSFDSRYWGFVDAAAIKGRPLVVYFSYDGAAGDPLPWLTDIRWRRLGSVIH